MVQKSMLTIFVFLQFVSTCCASDRLRQVATKQKSYIDLIRAQRKHCAALIQMRIEIEKELKIFEAETRRVVGYAVLEQEREEVDRKLRSDQWRNFKSWYSAHHDREALFLDCRNSGDDLAKLYGVLQPAEPLMQSMLDRLQSFNRNVKFYCKKNDSLSDEA